MCKAKVAGNFNLGVNQLGAQISPCNSDFYSEVKKWKYLTKSDKKTESKVEPQKQREE